jgi:anion-transporting  ArsA/GET3 family ATPase
MVVVLGVSLVFVDLLYAVKYGFDASGNKWREGFDSSGIDVSGVDVSGIDVSGSDTFTNRRIGFETEKAEKVDISNTLETMFNQIREIQEKNNEDPRNAVNPMVGAKGVLQENISGNSIEEVQKSSSDVKSMINTVKEMSPEVKDSLKSIHTVDINEINKLINNLSEVAASFKNNGA